ncbi:MAG: acetolactate synthase large subunit [Caldilineaceae bacterium]|nr:acetolactate synthase large subunit [Caldilineaceae bacterium]
MNGAQSLIRTLVDGGVDLCFMNPGTSEMHFVSALDSTPQMRSVLALFEGVVTGAADGYARMRGTPAATLLHLGPGLANGIANLHNARRAETPMVNIVGEHATYHRQYNAPLTSDIEALAWTFSGWVRTAQSSTTLAADAAEAIAQSQTPPGQIATLILPADTAWGAAERMAAAPPLTAAPRVDAERICEIARILRRGEPAVILVGGQAAREKAVTFACRIGQTTGARVMGDRAVARIERGAGRPKIERIPYPVDQAVRLLAGTRHLILVGTQQPVAFFAYPGKPSLVAPPDCQIHTLAAPGEDILAALADLADEVDAMADFPNRYPLDRPPLPTGDLTIEKIWTAVGALMPEDAIISDEAITSGRNADAWTAGAPPHDWLHVTGGSIGQGMPVATGAAVACPDRKVLSMQADGSAMYTLQSLWTQAREGLHVITVLFANHAYAILQGELRNVQAPSPGSRAAQMLHLNDPAPDWVKLAQGMGVPAARAEDADAFVEQFQRALAADGPSLIEVLI